MGLNLIGLFFLFLRKIELHIIFSRTLLRLTKTMEALINLKDCKEYMTITLNGQQHQIKLAGTINEPYFCGKDVCEVLGYKDLKDALWRYVDNEEKVSLQHMETVVGTVPTTVSIGKSYDELSYNDGKAVYISEAGLYSLIMSSQAPFAKKFRKLVCKVILPSIRKYGSYQVESQLSEAMEKLALKEKSEKDLMIRTERAERKAIRINKFMRRVTVKEHKLEWIYIATTQVYSMERLFKVGSTTRLSSRISGYNTGRPLEDIYYYCWVVKCYNSKELDYHIQKLLVDFKHRDNAELYCGIKFGDLKAIVSFIVENYDASIDYINTFIKTRLDASLEEEDEPPPRLDCKRITYQIGEHTETIDLEKDEMSVIREELVTYWQSSEKKGKMWLLNGENW